jgi:P4 family phage/plasmid primase-like protien
MDSVTSNGARFFSPDYGLMVYRVVGAVQAQGPVMVDEQDHLWVYVDGVWRPDRGDIRRRVAALLGDRMRVTHRVQVQEVLRADSGLIEIAPTPDLINFRNGMLRWGADPDPVLLDHHPEYLSTVQLPIEWDPAAECPEFDDFLAAVVPEDDRDRAWQVLGYLLMSGNPFQRMIMLTGAGGNGKGVYLNVVRGMLGNMNTAAEPLQDLGENRFSTAELHGKLANICGDIDATFIEKTARIKELCGDDRMKGERKGETQFYFTFWGKAIFSANAIPGAADSSRGWIRRWEVVPFPYTPTKPDPSLSDRLVSSELPGIAVKAVYALRDLMARGEFTRGESADMAHAEFAEKANRVLRWLGDPDSNVSRDPDVFNKGTTLLAAFRQWDAHEQGNSHRDIGKQKFNELARQAGLEQAIIRGNRGYYGVRVNDGVMTPPADQPWLNRTRGLPPQNCTPEINSEPDTLL